jgi:glycerol-3-phosphate acyltransferase PlsY
MDYLIIIVTCYLLGAINPAYIIGRLFHKVDIRDLNSQNAGTSNMWMTFGKRKGITVGLVDILKGVIPIIILRLIYPENDIIWVLGGLSAIIGHIFPFYLKFHGGKGTATFGGVVLGLLPIPSLILLVLFFAILWITDFIAISTLFVVIIVPIIMSFYDYEAISIILIVFFSCLSFYKHYPNFIRIWKKDEKGFRGTLKK